MNPILAGILAAIPLSLLGMFLMLRRGRDLVKVLQADSQEADSLTATQWYWLMYSTLGLAPLLFGILAGIVFNWLDNQFIYLAIALGAAALFTILAWSRQTPLRGEKTVMNWLVALDFGLLLPLLSGI
jgi:ABC-type Mn2+/Zn2+ transport system permease subunit